VHSIYNYSAARLTKASVDPSCDGTTDEHRSRENLSYLLCCYDHTANRLAICCCVYTLAVLSFSSILILNPLARHPVSVDHSVCQGTAITSDRSVYLLKSVPSHCHSIANSAKGRQTYNLFYYPVKRFHSLFFKESVTRCLIPGHSPLHTAHLHPELRSVISRRSRTAS
jgi:hypothetical protein